MRTFVIGDIHGGYLALLQCFKRSGFNYEKDCLIVLGDVCDGWHETEQCIDELLKIKNIIFIIGNHDMWALDWMTSGYLEAPDIWTSQGGKETMKSYQTKSIYIDGVDEYYVPEEHIKFLRDSYAWYKENNNVFVHGGIIPERSLKEQDIEYLTWDRNLFESAHWKHYHGKQNLKFGGYKNIFIGHSTTQNYGSLEPLHYCNVWNLDTGCGWNGKLTILNVDTKEYFQSDLTPSLYPEIRGRS